MFEDFAISLDDLGGLAWLILALVLLFVWGLSSYVRTRRFLKMLHGVIGAFNQPFVFYDDKNRLAFYTSGLILFDKQAIHKLKRLDERPQPDREIVGEIEIDHNTYRFRSKLLEYAPGKCGTIMFLEYHRPAPVNR